MSKRETRLSVDYTGTKVLFSVLNQADKIVATRSFDFDELPNEIADKAKLYGLNKLLTDRTSAETDKVKKLDAMSETFGMLCDGEWAKERVVGAIVVSVVVEALARLKGITIPVAQKALASYDKATKAKILANKKVQELAEEIRKERDAAKEAKLDDLIETTE